MRRCECLQQPIFGFRTLVTYISRGTEHSAYNQTERDGRMEKSIVIRDRRIRLLALHSGGFPYTTG
jgi:hypothetical protein